MVSSVDPPAPLLQPAVLGKPKPVARNVMEGFLLGRFFRFEKRTSKSKRALLLRKE